MVKEKTKTSCCSVCLSDSLGLYSYPREPSDDSGECVNSASHSPMPPTQHPEEENASLLFCPPKLWAFCLRLKTWGLVSHKHLYDVETDVSFDDDLYMKDRSRKQSLDEIVGAYMEEGKFIGHESLGRKGRGLNILLVGDSGTGKTYTAGKHFLLPSGLAGSHILILSFDRMSLAKIWRCAVRCELWRPRSPSRSTRPKVAGDLHARHKLERHGPS